MKRNLTIAILLSVLAVGIAAIPSIKRISFSWDSYNDPLGGTTFNLYHATAANGPWTIATNLPAGTSNAFLMVVPGVHFYYMTASNFWGESDPSNVVGTPPVPTTGTLRIDR